jgi:hypothetical protein
MDLFRVAVVQAGSVPFDRKRSTMKDNARLAVRQYLGWRGINPVWVSPGYDRRERLELGPGVYANPFRLGRLSSESSCPIRSISQYFGKNLPDLRPTFQTKNKIKRGAGQFRGGSPVCGGWREADLLSSGFQILASSLRLLPSRRFCPFLPHNIQ